LHPPGLSFLGTGHHRLQSGREDVTTDTRKSGQNQGVSDDNYCMAQRVLLRTHLVVIRQVLGRLSRLGFGRAAGLAAARRLYPSVARTPLRRVLSLFGGSVLIGTGVSLFLQAQLGVPPYDVLISAVTGLVPISHGQAAWVLSGLLFGVATLLGRRPSGWGVAYVIATGAAVDAVSGLINAPENLLIRLGFVGIGTLCIAAGVSLVVHAGTTGGVFELLMLAAQDRGFNPSRFRFALEVAVIVAGVVLGGSAGLATAFFALTIAPLLKIIGQALADHSRGRSVRLTEPEAAEVPRVPARAR